MAYIFCIIRMNPQNVNSINVDIILEEIGGDRKLLAQLVETALHDLPLNMAALKYAAERYELEKVGHIAHAIKTVLAHWDAKSAHQEALLVETAAREGAIFDAIEATERLGSSLVSVLDSLRNLKS
jgi:HPt (histidine-containing phosphotransfer) domain-containing protein